MELFLGYTEEARDRLVALLRDPTVDPAIQLKAANDILDRAFGKPASSLDVRANTPGSETFDPSVLRSMDQQELESLIMTLSKVLAARVADDAVEVPWPKGRGPDGG